MLQTPDICFKIWLWVNTNSRPWKLRAKLWWYCIKKISFIQEIIPPYLVSTGGTNERDKESLLKIRQPNLELTWYDEVESISRRKLGTGAEDDEIKRLVRAPSSLFINFRAPHHQVESKQSKAAYDTWPMTNSRTNIHNLWRPATWQATENRTVL